MKNHALMLLRDGRIVESSARDMCRCGPDCLFAWTHVDGRAEEARGWLEQHADLPEAALRALLAVETRPRTEPIEAGALVNLRGLGATPEDDPDKLVSIRCWAERGRVITVSFRSLAALPAVEAAMRGGKLHDPGDLIAALARRTSEELDPVVAALGDAVDACEADIDPNRVWPMRVAIARARSDAIAYRRFVVPERQALEQLAVLEVDWLDDDDRLHLREAADRFARMAEELEAVRERSALLHEQLTDLRAETVETRTLLLSIVALVFLPLTFLTGLLGMNVAGIPYAQAPWAFWGVVGICLAIAALVMGWFVARHWFR